MRAAAFLALALCGAVSALDNGQGLTPPMGWSTWRAFKCNYDEGTINKQAQALVNLGLLQKGFSFVNVDDCWSLPTRDNNGHILADPAKFPSGIPALSKNLTTLGLKFGLFSAAGTSSCTQGAGSLTYEQSDANDFAAWNVKYLKYADCNGFQIPAQTRFTAMRDALNRTG